MRFNRKWVIGILLIGTVGCGMLGTAGRLGTVDHNTVTATAAADVDARVDARVDAALASFTSTIQSMIETKISTEVKAQVGDHVGRDQNHSTTDSLTSVILACGLIIMPVGVLTLYYRHQMTRSFQAARRVIKTVESAREHKRCDCGKCADCIVRTLGARGDRVGKTLHKLVKAVT